MHIHKANKQHQNLVVNRRVGTAIGKSIADTAIAILAKIDSPTTIAILTKIDSRYCY